MTFALDLAERVLSVASAEVSPQTRHWTVLSMLDTLGVAIAGADEPGVMILDKVVTQGACDGACLLFGSDRRVGPLDAALVNGMAAHALDYDASNPYFAGHATMHLVAGAFAGGELVGASGRNLLRAYLAGFEAQMRIARAMQPAHSEQGWFPSSTIGVIGVAATAGCLLGLPAKDLATAIAISTNFSSGLLAHAGTMMKPLAAGHSARNGVLAALLARDGCTGQHKVFEHKHGYMTNFDVAGRFDAKDALADWGRPFDIVVTATGIKQHPCCGIVHAAIDVLSQLVAEHRLTPDDIARVEAALMTDELAHVDRPNPANPLEAKFSGQYCLARTILNRRPVIEDFEGDAHRDATTRDLMTRIRICVHPEMVDGLPRHRQGRADVEITTKDGRHIRGRLDQPLGRDPARPITDEMLHAKFINCAQRALTPATAARVLELMLRLDDGVLVRDITSVMSQGALRRAP